MKINYETFGTNEDEIDYVSPKEVSKETIDKIKARQIGYKVSALFQ